MHFRKEAQKQILPDEPSSHGVAVVRSEYGGADCRKSDAAGRMVLTREVKICRPVQA
jgi:hypothetical protein